MAFTFDADYYKAQRGDVYLAYLTVAGTPGAGSWPEFAEAHYNNHGWRELANPHPNFNTEEYLDMYPDIRDAGINPFQHFLNHGVHEGRAPSASFPKLGAEFNAETYLDANPDLVDAGITTPEQAYAHFVLHGQFEGRAGAPAVDSGVPGQTFLLQTAADNIVGTSNNDTINGLVTNAPGETTLSAIDTIDGGAGRDTLNITVSGTATETTNGADVKNVEVVNVRNVGTGTAKLDASTVLGLEEVYSDRSTGDFEVENLGAGAIVGLKGNGVVQLGAVTATYVDAATEAYFSVDGGTGAAAAGAVTINGGTNLTKATISGSNGSNSLASVAFGGTSAVKDLTINAGSALQTGDITGLAGNAKITVKGAGSANIGTLEATNVVEVDGSGNTGGITTTLNAVGALKFTGGSGNDVVTTGGTLTTGTVDGGAGSDTLILANVAHANTAALAAKYKNFETLRLNGTFDASLIEGITAIELSGATNNISKLSATQASAVTALADVGATTLALADATGTSDAVTLSLGNGRGNAFDATSLTVNGVETLNLKANASATAADKTSVIGGFTADQVTTINLTGTAFNITNAATTKAVTIDASALTGDGAATPKGLTLAGNLVNGSTVIGSSVSDEFTLGNNFATYNGGAGDDVFKATAAQLNTGANYNIIDGGEGTDTLNITGGGTLNIVDNNLSKVTGIEKIVIETTGDNDQSIQTGGWFDAAFKAGGVDLTTAAGKGNITIDMTTFSGAAKISAETAGTGAGEGKIDIQTGSGADEITVKAVAAGESGVVKTFDGDDKITTAGDEAFEITAGKGNDTITLGSTGIDTIVFESTAANNGVDAITGFEFGASKDILNVKAFINAATAAELGATIGGSLDVSSKNVVTLKDIQELSAANFGSSASSSVLKTAANQKLFVIADVDGDADSIQNMYYVTTDASNVATVTLVGTINEGAFHADNFVTN